jgi:hypothetical protein
MVVHVAEEAEVDREEEHHAEVGRAVRQPAMCGGHGRGEAW